METNQSNGAAIPRRQTRKSNGARLRVPLDIKLLDLAAKAIELEERGQAPNNAAKQIGVSVYAYTILRDAALLAQRDDLTAEEAKTVKHALVEIETTRRVAKPGASIAPITKRIWGKSRRLKKTSNSATRAKRFDNAIEFLLRTNEMAVDLLIPFDMTDAQANKANRSLSQAETAIRKLSERIREAQYG